MADEISYSIFFSMANGGSKQSRTTGTVKADQSAVGYVADVQNIGTSAENIAMGSVGAPGWAYFKNLDATNFVLIGYDATGFKDVIKLKAGEECWVRLSQAAPQAKADTLAIELEYIIFED